MRASLEESQIYPWDEKLFKELGLNIPARLETGKEHYIGEVKFFNSKSLIENQKDHSSVKIWLTPMPAQFWRFEIYAAEGNKLTKVETGSGSLTAFWQSLKQIATGMFVIKSVGEGG